MRFPGGFSKWRRAARSGRHLRSPIPTGSAEKNLNPVRRPFCRSVKRGLSNIASYETYSEYAFVCVPQMSATPMVMNHLNSSGCGRTSGRTTGRVDVRVDVRLALVYLCSNKVVQSFVHPLLHPHIHLRVHSSSSASRPRTHICQFSRWFCSKVVFGSHLMTTSGQT